MRKNLQCGYVGMRGLDMRKIMKYLTLFLTICLISGCNFLKSSLTIYVENISDTIVKCFDEKDIDTLKSLFCDSIKSKNNLDEQIEVAFEKYDGHSISYKVTDKGWKQESIEKGKCVKRNFTPEIENIVTDANNQYSIGFNVYQINERNPSREGVTIIVLSDSNGNEIAVIE